MPVPNHTQHVVDYFNAHVGQYDYRTHEGCGKFTEGCVEYLRLYDQNIGHLKKYGGSTQWNGHAIDAVNYHDPSRGTYQSVDLLASAESANARPQWLIQEVYYTAADWYLIDAVEPEPIIPSVPWVAYNESLFNDRLQKQLAYDYGRRPQAADFMVSVWSARVFHSTYMGPDKKPLGFDAAMSKHRPEWCNALGVIVDGIWF